MSDLFSAVSTADTGVRSALDWYETPAWMTRSLLLHHPLRHPQHPTRIPTVLECAAGRGAITRVLQTVGCRVIENDFDPAHQREHQLDMRLRASWTAMHRLGPIDYVVTNLPFRDAHAILEAGLDIPRVAFITLLLKSFDEPTFARGYWLSQHPWTRKICLPRHKFRGTGSPSMASDWFVFERVRDLSLAPCIVDAAAKTR